MQRVIDLTHVLSSEIPCYDGDCCFTLRTAVDYNDCVAPNLFRTQNIEAKAGAGTHIDAPAHAIPNGITIDQLHPKDFVTQCVVIRVDDKADAQYLVTPGDIEAFEKKHGMIPPRAFVLFYTGWDVHWKNPKKYRNDLQHPALHESTAKLLLKREIVGIGIDTLSPDSGGVDFPVHRVLLGAGKYIVENIANAKSLPLTGATILVMPLNIKDGTEAPIRLIALVD